LGYITNRLFPIRIEIALEKPPGEIFFQVSSNRILPLRARAKIT
jgi:hypothetical protein